MIVRHLTALLFAAGLAGCVQIGGNEPPRSRVVLPVEDDKPKAVVALPLGLRIDSVQALDPYQKDRMTLRMTNEQGLLITDFAKNYVFEDRLPAVVQRDLGHLLQSAHLFLHGVTSNARDMADLALEVRIERFDLTLNQSQQPTEATITWTLTLKEAKTLRVVQQKRMNLNQKLSAFSFAEGINALTKLYNQQLDNVVVWLQSAAVISKRD